MKYSLIIAGVCIFAFCACNHVTKSIKETLHPIDTIAKNKVKKNESRGPDIKKIIDSQVNAITSIIETHTSQHIEIHVDGEDKKFLADSQRLEKAEEALKNLPQYQGEEIFVYQSIYFYGDGSINLMLRHPTNFKYIDKYSYKDGKWSKPSPVKLSVKDDAESKMVSLKSLSFINAFKVAKTYNEKVLEVEGANPTTSVYVSIWNNRILWFPSTINGSRERYSIDFNADGSLKGFSQN